MRQTGAIVLFASIATTTSALLLHPSAPIRRNYITSTLNALEDDYDGRPSYRRYGGGERKNRFSRNNNKSNYNTNNEDDAYEMARKLASRRGLNLPIEQDQPPMNSYSEDYRDAPVYGSDYGGVAEQELPRIPMDYNANKNYNEGYGTLKDLTWGGMKEQNDNKYNDDRYEARRSRSMGQRYKTPQPPRQPPREVRQSDFRSRNDSMYQSGPSSQRAQSSVGRRGDAERMRRMQQPRPPPNSRSSSSSTAYPFEVNRVNKLSELASTPERIDSPPRRPMMSQYPPPNAPYRPSVPYQQPPPPFRPPSTLSGFSSTSEQMGRAGSMSSQFMPPPPPPPPPYVQMPEYQQQRRQASNFRAPSIPLSQLALQPNIQPVDQPTSSQQSQSFSAEFSQQQSQQMTGSYSDRRPPPQQQPQSFPGGQSQESFGGNPSASFSPLPFQQQSQADFTRPFQGGSESSQAQSSSPPNSLNQGAGMQPPPGFNGPPPHPFDREGPPPPPPPFDQGGPPPFGPDVHIFQNPFMNEPSFQEQRSPTQQKSQDDGVKVPKDPNVEKRRRRTVSNSSNNNPGSGMKIPKDPLVERRRKQQQQQQQSNSRSNDGMKVPKDPFQQRKSDMNSRRNNQEVKVPKEPTMRNQQIERRPKEPRPKSSSNNTRIPREPKINARSEKVPKEPKRGVVDSKGDDLSYEDFASFFDMPRL